MNDKANIIWKDIMKNGKKNQSHKHLNVLDEDDLNSILGTMDFFGCSRADLGQTFFDLRTAKYRVFDWLAMGLMGRIENPTALSVLVYAFKKADYNEKKFIDNLRIHDYQIETEWQDIYNAITE